MEPEFLRTLLGSWRVRSCKLTSSKSILQVSASSSGVLFFRRDMSSVSGWKIASFLRTDSIQVQHHDIQLFAALISQGVFLLNLVRCFLLESRILPNGL